MNVIKRHVAVVTAPGVVVILLWTLNCVSLMRLLYGDYI